MIIKTPEEIAEDIVYGRTEDDLDTLYSLIVEAIRNERKPRDNEKAETQATGASSAGRTG